MYLYSVGYILKPVALLGIFYSCKKAFFGNFYESLGFFRAVSDFKGSGGISAVAIIECSNIYSNNVSVT
ncbi:hypothetical protein SDC9_150595 [bioreactor metagenome]|uniref:Uncharacterized protein n=1 Tax=bioreactor metagenome TaxID=1076179 RepID=A0A645ENH7_9ZZZZ